MTKLSVILSTKIKKKRVDGKYIVRVYQPTQRIVRGS